MKKFLEVGRIVAAQGLKGEFRVESWSSSLEFICDFDRLYLDKGEKEVTVELARPHKNVVVMKIKGIDTVEQAQMLRNKILYMNRDDVELEEGCFFIQDLIGLDVVDADDGTVYGKLCDVSFTGANDVYHIKRPDGKGEWLIPAIPDVVAETDIEGGKMTIHKMEGLFDED